MPRFQAYSPSRVSAASSAPGAHSAQSRARRKQAGGFAIDQFHVIGFGDGDLADALQLQQLAFDHHLRQLDQHVQHAEIALPQRNLKRLHVQPVAGENRSMIAPDHIDRRPPAARLRHVDHVVVHQRRGVDHLYHRGHADQGGILFAKQFAAEQNQNRPQTFAAARLQILADIGDRIHRRDRFDADLAFHLVQIARTRSKISKAVSERPRLPNAIGNY